MRPVRRSIVCLAAAATCLFVSGCARGGTPGGETEGPVPAEGRDLTVDRTYRGTVSMGGRNVALRVTFRGPVDRLVASLSIPELDWAAEGDGVLEGARVRLAFPYGTDCPGTATVDARAFEPEGTLEGRLTASDCTGSEGGAFVLRIDSRRPR